MTNKESSKVVRLSLGNWVTMFTMACSVSGTVLFSAHQYTLATEARITSIEVNVLHTREDIEQVREGVADLRTDVRSLQSYMMNGGP